MMNDPDTSAEAGVYPFITFCGRVLGRVSEAYMQRKAYINMANSQQLCFTDAFHQFQLPKRNS